MPENEAPRPSSPWPRRGEWGPVLAGAAMNFCVLGGWYVLRAVRDEIGSEHRDVLDQLWTGTFFAMLVVVPLYTLLVARCRRGIFIPVTYALFALSLGAFAVGFRSADPTTLLYIERGFYIWTSVFNLFVLAVFWGFMSDLFRSEQGRRLFGPIFVGGTVGALVGPAVTAWLSTRASAEGSDAAGLDVDLLLFITIGALLVAAAIAVGLDRSGRGKVAARFRPESLPTLSPTEALKRGLVLVFTNRYLLGIVVLLLITSLGATFLYFLKSDLARLFFEDRDERRAFFASVDLYSNAATLLGQGVIVAWLIHKLGIPRILTLLSVVTGLGFAVLGFLLIGFDADAPERSVLFGLVSLEVARRAVNYAFNRPTRENLFTVLPRDDRYAAKSFIDTALYRGSDMVNGWVYSGLENLLHFTVAALAFTVVPVAAAGVVLALMLGKAQERRAAEE